MYKVSSDGNVILGFTRDYSTSNVITTIQNTEGYSVSKLLWKYYLYNILSSKSDESICDFLDFVF